MQDDQNGQKTMVLPSAEKTMLTRFIGCIKKYIFSGKRPSLAADGNTIMNLPWYPRKKVHFSLVLSPSRLSVAYAYCKQLRRPYKAVQTARQKQQKLGRFNAIFKMYKKRYSFLQFVTIEIICTPRSRIVSFFGRKK
jgi:hypothetical protein